jgi:type III restriction enzyme
MALHPDFPTDPYAVLDPAIRWYPGDEMLGEMGYAMLLPPLVHKVRQGVKAWRDTGYGGASATTRALLLHWFHTEHLMPQADGTVQPFRWFFAQREAVKSALWLYEVERARDPYALMRYDSSGRVSKGMFPEDWTRYVLKLATGSGKTKIASLLMAWSYFHKLYETDSELSTNFLLIAPNIIVLDRLRRDFDGARIFFDDPILPETGYEGRNWRDDFQLTVHIQDDIGFVGEQGNLFLTNIHRVFEGAAEPSFDDANTSGYFLGVKPTGKTTDSAVDLGIIIRDVPDLVVLNDEAHHLHDERSAWFKAIEDISLRLRQKGSQLSAQFDLSATPKHDNGAIFVQTIADYPLVEAIRQGVVKTPVLPDPASRAKLTEKKSAKFTEQYEDYIHLGYLEWSKVYAELQPTGKKSILFVMTDDTRNCDDVADYLEARYPELNDAVLVIHTKNNGEISEASTGKSKEELDKLRAAAREIDDPTSRYKAIVSVMVLREGWDVQNVVSIVGLRPYTSKARILPEQTLGRGLRRMFRDQPVQEKVSVIGTDAFMEFVEGIKVEGVELEYQPMGGASGPKSPIVVEVDRENADKDIERLDIDLPLLAPRIQREYTKTSAISTRQRSRTSGCRSRASRKSSSARLFSATSTPTSRAM